MRQIFVDTSAWIAIEERADPYHDKALAFRDEIAERSHLYITNYVLDEVYTLMLMNLGYQSVVDFKKSLDSLIQKRIIRVIWVDEKISENAWAIFEKFNRDKRWSFTDCVSYGVMKERGITEAFAFDHHFEQMGFVKQPH